MDTEKLRVRLRKLDDTVNDLRNLPPLTLSEYLGNKDRQAIVERWLQIAAQVCVDVAASVVAEYGLTAPDELPNLFVTLGEAGLIPEELGRRMVGLTRFRNILVHDYLTIDPKIVFERSTEGLVDFDDFGKAMVALIEKHESQDQGSNE